MLTDMLNTPWFLLGPILIILAGVTVVMILSLIAVFWPDRK